MPETSENFSIGVTGSLGDLDFTLDYFSIDVADYFSAISTLDVSTDPDSGDAYANYLALMLPVFRRELDWWRVLLHQRV